MVYNSITLHSQESSIIMNMKKCRISDKTIGIIAGNVRCPKYIESIYDILDYLLWLRLNGYKGGYYEDSMDLDENGKHIAYQTNAMYDCVMDVYYPDDECREHETQSEDIIKALEEWVNCLFEGS